MLVRLKQGWHGGGGANILDNWTTWWSSQHAENIPVNTIFADSTAGIYDIQLLENRNDDDVLIWRRSLWYNSTNPPFSFDPNTPNYKANPESEALRMLSFKYDNLFPPDIDKHFVFLKDTNEIRTKVNNPEDTFYNNLNAGEWWGRYALEAGKYAVAHNYRVVLLSPSSGDHTEFFWNQPSMLLFMDYASKNKHHIMVGLHEYSYVSHNLFALPDNDNATIEDLLASSPSSRRVGRFELLFDTLDKHNVDWPLIYFCEWGWAERDMPQTNNAMTQIISAFHNLYGKYYNYIRGNGTWYLATGFGTSLALKTNSLLIPSAEYTIHNEFEIEQRKSKVSGENNMGNCPAVVPVRTVSLWIPQYEKMTELEISQAYNWARYGFEDNNNVKTLGNHMLCPSHVDALRIHSEGLPGSILAVAYPEKIGSGVTEAWIRTNCPCAYEDNKQVVFLPKKTNECDNCLPVNLFFSQRDNRWRNDILGENTGHTKTIGNWGCLLVCYNIQAVYMGLCTDTPNLFNKRMVNANAFTDQYMNGAALATTFPTQVQYNGYNNRGTELNSRVRNYIDNGNTVPIQVDFHPETGQWDQHWCLAIGYRENDFYIIDPWVGDKVWLSTRYNITGDDIIQGVFYTKKTITPPPPVTGSPYGLHLRADPSDLKDAEYNEVQILLNSGGKTVKLLHNHPQTVFHKIGAKKPKSVVVRIMQSWGGRNITPQDFYNWNVDELIQKVNILKSYGIVDIIIEYLNEPNLNEEGLGLSWNNGFDFGIWLTAAINLFRTRTELAGLKFIYPGLSPGGTIPGVRYDSTLFLNDSLGCKNSVYGFGVHAYWSGGSWPMQTAINHVNNTKVTVGKPVYVTEVSYNARPSNISVAERGKQYAQFIKSVTTEGIYFFIGSASNNFFEPETWVLENGVSKGIAQALVNNL